MLKTHHLCATQLVLFVASFRSKTSSSRRKRSTRFRRKSSASSSSSVSSDDDENDETTNDGKQRRRVTNFDRLVQQNAWMFPQPQKDEDTESLTKFWQTRGVKDREMLKRLIELGGGVLAEMRLEDEMMMEERLEDDEKKKKNSESLVDRLDRMKILFPNCDVNAMLWKKPEVVLEKSFKEITKAAIEWKMVLRDVKRLDWVVENNPQILLMTSEEIGKAKDGLETLRREFFSFEKDEYEGEAFIETLALKTTNKNDSVVLKDDDDDDTSKNQPPPTTSTGFLITPEFTLANVVEGEPHILTSNLKRRTERLLERKQDLLQKAKQKGGGLGLFYLRQSTSTALFGKLFLMDTEEEEEEEQDKE